MKSLTDIPSEYKCHQNFYCMVWGDLTCNECGNKVCWQHKRCIGEIRNILGLSYLTVSNWLRKLRSHLPVSREVLDGTCEVDGSFRAITNFLYLGTSGGAVITLLVSLVHLIILRIYGV